MNERVMLVVFSLDGQRYALDFDTVVRVVRAVEITPLPKAPPIVPGLINVGGALVPVIDLRQRFGLASRGLQWTDQIVLARTAIRLVGLLVDGTEGLINVPPENRVDSHRVLPHLEYVDGVIKLDDGLMLIHDLGRCLSLEEEKVLVQAMDEAR